MELVLADINRWKKQMESEIENIDTQLNTVIPEQITQLEATKTVAVQKIKECDALLEKLGFVEDKGPTTESEAVDTAVAG